MKKIEKIIELSKSKGFKNLNEECENHKDCMCHDCSFFQVMKHNMCEFWCCGERLLEEYEEPQRGVNMKNLENVRRFVELDMLDNETIDIVTNIIDMHCKPLKLKELRCNMWIWDSEYEEYVRIYRIENDMIYLDDTYCLEPTCCHRELDRLYEEGRFYHYQPLCEV